MQAFISLISGIIFAAGLGISGMTNPENVINFLDITGNWDPSLMFVMVGAIFVHFIAYRIKNKSMKKPLLDTKFYLPTKTDIDLRLISGSAIFGLGWGIAGFCPAPAVSSITSFNEQITVFLISLFIGMKVYSLLPVSKDTKESVSTTKAEESRA